MCLCCWVGCTSHLSTPAIIIGEQILCDVRESIKIRDYCVYAEQTDTHFSLNAFAAPGIALVSVEPLKGFQAIFKQCFWWLAQSKDEFV
jgi:hypothetical protein